MSDEVATFKWDDDLKKRVLEAVAKAADDGVDTDKSKFIRNALVEYLEFIEEMKAARKEVRKRRALNKAESEQQKTAVEGGSNPAFAVPFSSKKKRTAEAESGAVVGQERAKPSPKKHI